MGSDPIGMDRLNMFALVIYIPDPLARFLDELRRELVPSCVPRAHVSVLPPRVVKDPKVACEQSRARARDFAPFDVEAGQIEVFPRTDVIYISVEAGIAQLGEMHQALNAGALAYAELFHYQPHITLAQEFDRRDLPRLHEQACLRWADYRHSRRFRAEVMTFVQNTTCNVWIDLAEFSLGAVTVP